MSLRILILLTLLSAYAPLHAALSPEDLKKLPPATIEAALPNEHLLAYYGYAARLFREGKKDEAVFWFYVGQLRYRFHLKANPHMDPSGDPALFSSLSATVGKTINEYAGGHRQAWGEGRDRRLTRGAPRDRGSLA